MRSRDLLPTHKQTKSEKQTSSAEITIKGEIIIDASKLFSLKHGGRTSEEQTNTNE